jgi:hypothetical protein
VTSCSDLIARKDFAFIFVSSLYVVFSLSSLFLSLRVFCFSSFLLCLLPLFLFYIFIFSCMFHNSLLSFVLVYFFLPVVFAVILSSPPCLHAFRLFPCFLFHSSLIPHVVYLFKCLFSSSFPSFLSSFPTHSFTVFPFIITLFFLALLLHCFLVFRSYLSASFDLIT